MLTEVQIALVMVVVTGILFALKMWRAAGGTEISNGTLKWILFLIALPIAWFFALPVIPAFPALVGEPDVISVLLITWIGSVASMGATFLGFATLVYAVLIKGVLGNAVKRKLFASTPAAKGAKK